MPGCSDILDLSSPAFSWGQAPKPPFSLRSFSNCTRSAIERSGERGLGGTPWKESVYDDGKLDDGADRYSRVYCSSQSLGRKAVEFGMKGKISEVRLAIYDVTKSILRMPSEGRKLRISTE